MINHPLHPAGVGAGGGTAQPDGHPPALHAAAATTGIPGGVCSLLLLLVNTITIYHYYTSILLTYYDIFYSINYYQLIL
jgi:hypothetical protein